MPYNAVHAIYGCYGSDATCHIYRALDCFDLPTHWATKACILRYYATYNDHAVCDQNSCRNLLYTHYQTQKAIKKLMAQYSALQFMSTMKETMKVN